MVCPLQELELQQLFWLVSNDIENLFIFLWFIFPFSFFTRHQKRAKINLTWLKVFHTLMHEFGFTMWTWMWQKILVGFSNTRLKFSSLDWMIPGFLDAIFVQRSILATELNVYPIPSPLSFITLTLGFIVSHTYI